MRSLLAVALVVFAGMFVLPAAGIAGPPAAEYIVVVRDGVDARAVAARDTQRYGAAVISLQPRSKWLRRDAHLERAGRCGGGSRRRVGVAESNFSCGG